MENLEMQYCEKCGSELAHLLGREELILNACDNETCPNFSISQPERSKREDFQDKLYCSVRCAQEGNYIFIGNAMIEYGYCKNVNCANYCFSNGSCKMRCSGHCGNTMRGK